MTWLACLGIALGVVYLALCLFGAALLNGYDVTSDQVDGDTL